MKSFKELLGRFEKAMAAASFAEAGEFETAKGIMKEDTSHEKKADKPGRKYTSKLAVETGGGE